MAKSLSQIEKQIAALQREADRLRRKEAAGVVARIREAIAHYGLTPDDLFGPRPGRRAGAPAARQAVRPAAAAGVASGGTDAEGGAAPARSRARKAARAPSPPKYRDENGRTWTGRGKRPEWFKAALAAGKTAADLEIPA